MGIAFLYVSPAALRVSGGTGRQDKMQIKVFMYTLCIDRGQNAE